MSGNIRSPKIVVATMAIHAWIEKILGQVLTLSVPDEGAGNTAKWSLHKLVLQ